MPTHESLAEERAQLLAQARELVETAIAEERDLTSEEKENYANIRRQDDELKAAISQLAEETVDEELSESAMEVRSGTGMEEATKVGPRNLSPSRFTGSAEIHVPKYERNDGELVKRVAGLHRALIHGDVVEARALSEGTGSAGGFLVPEEFSADVIELMGQLTPFANREFLRIIPMGRDVMHVPTLATRPTVSRIAENAAGTGGTDPAFGEVVLTANKFGRVLPMSEELLADESIGLVEFLRDLYAEILAENRNNLVINGTGTNEPEGVRVNGSVATQAITMTDAGTVWAGIINTYDKLSPANRADGIWVTSPQGWAVLAKQISVDKVPIIQQIAEEPFARLLGRPLFVTEAVPETLGGGSDETELIYGNFKKGYVFGDRQQLEVRMDASGKYFENFQAAIRISERFDGAVGGPQYFVRGTGVK